MATRLTGNGPRNAAARMGAIIIASLLLLLVGALVRPDMMALVMAPMHRMAYVFGLQD